MLGLRGGFAPHKLWVIRLLVKLSLARAECLTLSLSLGVTPANITINDISLKTRF